jgi:hypothetical protein
MTTQFCVLQGAKLAVEAATRQARVRFSEADGATLIRGYLQAVKEHGHLQFLAECASNKRWWYTCGTRQMRAIWLETQDRLYSQVVRVLGIQGAIRDITEERLRKNGVNRNFGLLKLAHDLNNPQGADKAFKELRQIARSIPRKQGAIWRHPDELAGFDSKTNLVLARELADIRDMTPITVLAQTLDNKFAFIYRALQNAFCDDIRNACRRPEGQPQVDAANVADPTKTPGITGNLDGVVELVDRAKTDFKSLGTVAVLNELKLLLADRDSLIDMDARQIGAELVRRVAQKQGVTERQARNYLDTIKCDTNSKNLQTLRGILRDGAKAYPYNSPGKS